MAQNTYIMLAYRSETTNKKINMINQTKNIMMHKKAEWTEKAAGYISAYITSVCVINFSVVL